MTDEGEKPQRSIRVSDPDWERWRKAANRLGLSRSALVHLAVNTLLSAEVEGGSGESVEVWRSSTPLREK